MEHQVQLQQSERKEEQGLQLKEKPQAILLAKTTRSLIKVKVDNRQIIWINSVISDGTESLVKTIKTSDRTDMVFLLIFPTPVWPIYFAYRGKIREFIKNPNKNTEEMRRKILSDYNWIKGVIESSETSDHIKCCKSILCNWSSHTIFKIRGYRCPFYKTKEFKKTIELYRRLHKDLNKQIADKSVGIIHPLNID